MTRHIIAVLLILVFSALAAPYELIEHLIGEQLHLELGWQLPFRVVFLLGLSLIFLWLFRSLFFTPPIGRPLLLGLLGVCIILIGVLALDSNSFVAEESSITHFTFFLILNGAVIAGRNAWLNSGRLRWLWAAISAAFVFLSIDEMFEVHERVGAKLEAMASLSATDSLAANLLQDAVTLSYALGALVFAAIFFGTFKRHYLNLNNPFLRVFITAVVVYAVSTVLDTADVFVAPMFPGIDAAMLMNMIEEVMETTAAMLFLLSFIYASPDGPPQVLSRSFDRRINSAVATGVVPAPGINPRLIDVFAASIVVVALLLRLWPLPAQTVIEESFEVERIADRSSGLIDPDGVLWDADFGLLIGDERGRRVIAIRNGIREVLISEADGLRSPEGLAVHRGRLYVCDDSGSQVLVYDNGKVSQFLGPDQGLKSPESIAWGNSMYLADEGAGVIYKDMESAFTTRLGPLRTPEEMLFHTGRLYVTGDTTGAVIAFNPDGEIDAKWQFNKAEGITVWNAQVLVSDSATGIVHNLDTGKEILHFRGRYRRLSGISADDAGNLYVVAGRSVFRVALPASGSAP